MNQYQQPSQQSSVLPNTAQQYEQSLPPTEALQQSRTVSGQPQYAYPQQQPLQLPNLPQVPSITIVNNNTAQAVAQTIAQTAIRKNLDYKPLISALYFLFIGLSLGLFWALLGIFLCMTIIFAPLGLAMLKFLPAITLLRRE